MFYTAPPVVYVNVHSDASGSFGCGALMAQASWFQATWPGSWSSVDITTKELVPIVLAAAIWGRFWCRQSICFHTDNMGVVAILRKRSARHPVALHLLRCLYFYAATYNFDFIAQHIPGVDNIAADAISRDNINLLSSLCPQATQVSVPPPLQDLLLRQQPDWGSRQWIRLFGRTLQTPWPPLLSQPTGLPLLAT